MKLRIKLILGFVVLAIMLFISGFWSIYEFNIISDSVGGILEENYQSIVAANKMNRAVELQNEGLYLILLKENKKGQTLIQKGDSLFEQNYAIALNNITISDEKKFIDTIKVFYADFKSIIKGISNNSFEFNSNKITSAKEKLIIEINKLASVNDKMMNEEIIDLQSKADRAKAPGIIAVIAAFVFILLFNYLINYYLVNPIINITDSIDKFKDKGKPFDVKIESNDEIKDLSNSVHDLCEYLRYKDDK